MITKINAWFQRQIRPAPGKRLRRAAFENHCVQGMEFDVAEFERVTPARVARHPKAPSSADGWTLQGYCPQHSTAPKTK